MIEIEVHHKQNSIYYFEYYDSEFVDCHFSGEFCVTDEDFTHFEYGEWFDKSYLEENLDYMRDVIMARIHSEEQTLIEVVNNILIKNEDRD